MARRSKNASLTWDDSLYLLFEDGKVAIVDASPGYDHDVELELKTSVEAWDDLPNLVELGVVSQADHAKWKADRDAANKSDSERRERAQYEALKAKFG